MLLTEILLDVTDEEIYYVAKDAHRKATKGILWVFLVLFFGGILVLVAILAFFFVVLVELLADILNILFLHVLTLWERLDLETPCYNYTNIFVQPT